MTRTIKGEADEGDITVVCQPRTVWYGEIIEIDILRDTLRETRFSRREASEVIQAFSEMMKDL